MLGDILPVSPPQSCGVGKSFKIGNIPLILVFIRVVWLNLHDIGRMLPIDGGDAMTVALSIGDAIRAARRRHRLTQEQLAELAGTSTRTVREIEHGSGSTSIATVAAVADVVGLTLGVVG